MSRLLPSLVVSQTLTSVPPLVDSDRETNTTVSRTTMMMQMPTITRKEKWRRVDEDIVASSFSIRLIHLESVLSFSMRERDGGLIVFVRHGKHCTTTEARVQAGRPSGLTGWLFSSASEWRTRPTVHKQDACHIVFDIAALHERR